MDSLIFTNSGILSLLDLTTMGSSSKREDSTKTGKFDSGLKYAISILVRNEIYPIIRAGKHQYEFKNRVIQDKETLKTKEIIVVLQRDWTLSESTWTEYETAFAVDLGYDWEFWMAIRELYSNCMDENGGITKESHCSIEEYSFLDNTTIILPASEKLQEVIDNWDSYFILNSKLLAEKYRIRIYENHLPNNEYVIYKNGVRVYSDPSKKSLFLYDVMYADIDEMRVLRNASSIECEISYALRGTDVTKLIATFISDINEEYFEHGLSNGGFSSEWVKYVNDLFELSENSIQHLSKYMLDDMISDDRFELGKKRVSINSHWSSPMVTVTLEKVENPTQQLTFEETVSNICKSQNISIDFPIYEAVLEHPHKVLANGREKCLYIDKTFNENDCWQIVKQQFRLIADSDAIFKEFVKILNK